MNRNPQSGVTLIEILIAITLLSLLSAGILTAMRLGLGTMERTDARMVRNRRVTSARRIIENEIGGYIATTATAPDVEGHRLSVRFLQAEPASMRFVSAFSLQDAWRGRAQIAALQVIPGDNNEGVRLIVNEIPYTGPAQAGQFISGFEPGPFGMAARFAPIVAGPQSFIVADRLRYCRFSYLERLPVQPFDNWRPDWPRPQGLPAGIRIEMASLDTARDHGSDLHPTTVTVPFSVSLTPGWRNAAQ